MSQEYDKLQKNKKERRELVLRFLDGRSVISYRARALRPARRCCTLRQMRTYPLMCRPSLQQGKLLQRGKRNALCRRLPPCVVKKETVRRGNFHISGITISEAEIPAQRSGSRDRKKDRRLDMLRFRIRLRPSGRPAAAIRWRVQRSLLKLIS